MAFCKNKPLDEKLSTKEDRLILTGNGSNKDNTQYNFLQKSFDRTGRSITTEQDTTLKSHV